MEEIKISNIWRKTSLTFKQLVNGATHIMGGHIDHAFFNDHEHSFISVDVDQYSPYYTSRDHDGLLITLMYE